MEAYAEAGSAQTQEEVLLRGSRQEVVAQAPEGDAQAEVIPPEPGTAPIPEGTIRLWHYTHPNNLESIRQQGLLYSKGRGDSGTGVDEPSKGVWASTQQPDAGKFRDMPFVEYYAHPEQIGRNAEHFWDQDPVEWARGYHHVIMQGDVPPEQIVAIHEPWHAHYRYMDNEFPDQAALDKWGETPDSYDWALDEKKGGDPQLAKAIQHWKRRFSTVEEGPTFPTLQDATDVNREALAGWGQTNHALLRPEVLEGALGRAQNYWYYENSLPKAAAALAHGVGQAQAFEDGNKRTAYWLTHGFLHANGLGHLAPDDDEELADHLIGYAEGTHGLEDTARMFEARHSPHTSSWRIERVTSEDVWMRDYIDAVLASRAPDVPDPVQKIGACTVSWEEIDPGVVRITSVGGSIDDRSWTEGIVRDQLLHFGYHRAEVYLEPLNPDKVEKTSHWNDIMAKAKRLIQSGQVQVMRNGYNNVVGHVIGDHGEYMTEISRDDPNSRAITGWQCECPWDQYAWQRTRQWKKYEGRPCAHVLALYWKGLSTPLDGDVPAGTSPSPGQRGPIPGGSPPIAPAPPGATVGPPQAPSPAPAVPGMDAAPASPEVLPQSPMDQLALQMNPAMPGSTPPGMPAPPNSVSVPGARPPTPFGPVQYPGGTYSKTAAEEFLNGDRVRLNRPTFGVKEGREGATDAGEYVEVPAGKHGECMGQDPTTGWVDVIFPLAGGPMTSYHVRCFVEPSEITKVPGPTPFIKAPRR